MKTVAWIFDTPEEYANHCERHADAPHSVLSFYTWEELPSRQDAETITDVTVVVKSRTTRTLPPSLSAFHNCTQLILPSRLLPSLAHVALPEKLNWITLRGNRKLEWPRDLVLPGVVELELDRNTLTVEARALPSLKGVGVTLDRKNERGRVLDALVDLEDVSLGNVQDESIFDTLVRHPLKRLRFIDSRLKAIARVGDIPTLENVELTGLPHVRSIKPLLQLPNLTRLYIHTCKRIEDAAEVLPALKRLEWLNVIACGNIGLTAVLPELRRKLEHIGDDGTW
ncbi:MAG TPA: hypothetical protein ENK57_00560 [Polyangiaceae bacterium]|nr:hypothetical protein [Polyangiaceae bacterium]